MTNSITRFVAGIASLAVMFMGSGAGAHSHGEPMDGQPHMAGMHGGGHGVSPVGVPGDNMPAGAFMLNYRPMFMHMQGNQIGTNDVSPEFIVTTVPNPNAPPPALRVVPTEMDMQMHMFMAMYAPADWITLMAMTSYTNKEMKHITFRGPMGTNKLGTFTTEANGIGDTTLAAIFKAYDDGRNRVQFTAGLSLPTGSTTERDGVLAPTGATPTLRLPYAMQLGSGTYDLLPAVTWRRREGPWSFGARYMGVFRLGDNDQGYAFGDVHTVTAWGAYQWNPIVNTSLRIAARNEGTIEGRDAMIAAPVQTADPYNYGGERVDLLLGVNLSGQGALSGMQFAVEAGIPVYQDLNGPQMETDVVVQFSIVKMFMP